MGHKESDDAVAIAFEFTRFTEHPATENGKMYLDVI